jgi:hypothetical protein
VAQVLGRPGPGSPADEGEEHLVDDLGDGVLVAGAEQEGVAEEVEGESGNSCTHQIYGNLVPSSFDRAGTAPRRRLPQKPEAAAARRETVLNPC